ncbi:OmpA family protein [Leadbetterella byssophila]|uniref:OmpA family protein n=1 Tax=Leadbetterella byssophila TaxID=316068 RepID=UPI0039A3B24E
MQKWFCILTLLISCQVYGQDKKAQFYFEQAEKEFKLRKYNDAQINFEKFIMRDTTQPLAFYRLGQIHESFRNISKAKEYYLRTIKKDTNSASYPNAYMYLGSRALEESQYHHAKNFLNIALRNTQRNTKAYEQIQRQIRRADLGIKAMENPLNIKPIKLPSVINARERQYFPVLTADGNTLVFTAITSNEDEDLFLSFKENGQWTTPKPISSIINTPNNEGTCTISADGKIMVFTSCEGRNSYGSCDLFITRKEGDTWTEPQNLGPNVNSPYWDSQPSLSPDGSRLFFSSDRPFGVGKKDIWMSAVDEQGKWSKATNLGPGINTPENEVSPFVHANGSSLFYSSNGREGLGNHDIYMTNIQEGFKSESINLGYPINTPGDESGLFISADGKSALYSKQEGDNTYIYEFKVPEELSEQFERIYYIKGFIKDSQTKKPLYSSIELVNTKNGERVSRFLSDPITGDYMSTLPEEGEYVMYIETPGYFFKSLKFDFKEGNSDQELDILLTKIEKENKETLDNIFFDTGSAAIRPESEIELKKVVTLLKENPDLKVEISGHTDDVGNDKANMNLSIQRANAVVEYLKGKGIHAQRLVAKGYGESQPKVKNDSDKNRQLNRRIELKVL